MESSKIDQTIHTNEAFDIYKDIEQRTKGDIYIGVVGPVRTGKSTFIKRFMELLVIPNMENENEKNQTIDELPQSATGKTITTTEPKFIPKEAITITMPDEISLKVRMIDCVGYMVNGAVGHMENEKERMVKTPWFDYEIPFTKAAGIGTSKVITDHSTIGIVVTTDGSFGSLERTDYEAPEEKTIQELKELNKPFIVLLNSSHPYSEETILLGKELTEKHHVKVLPVNCEQLSKEAIEQILNAIVLEFPIDSIEFKIPKWIEALPNTHWLKSCLIETASTILHDISTMRDLCNYPFMATDCVANMSLSGISMENGKASVLVELPDKYYYESLSELLGIKIENEYQFMEIIKDLAKKREAYQDFSNALLSVTQKGYGVVTPKHENISLSKPELIKHGNKFGVKIKANAPSIHLIQANLTTEIAPIIGSEEQANDLIQYIETDTKENPASIWDVNIFGKTLEQLVDDGLKGKVQKMNEESQQKIQDTLEKVMNDSNGGLVCIII